MIRIVRLRQFFNVVFYYIDTAEMCFLIYTFIFRLIYIYVYSLI